MKMLIVTQYFWPERFLINDLAEKLTHNGVEVTVITGKPNYPEGSIYSGYEQNGVVSELYHQIEVIRVPLRPRNKGAINLARNYISFVMNGLYHMPKLLKKREFDVIFVFALSPITAAIPAIWLKYKKKAHLCLWVQDLWPASLKDTNYIKNRFVLFLVSKLVKWIYKRSDTLLGQSEAFVKEIRAFVGGNNIFYYPNSVDPILNKVVIPSDVDLDCLNHPCVVVFAGNIGKAQSIETIINSAIILEHRGVDCRIVFVGAGSMLNWAMGEVNKHKLCNVKFIGRLDSSFMPYIYKKSSGLLVTLTNKPAFKLTIPSKLQSILAAGKPVIASLNGEGARIVRLSRSGMISSAEDSVGLANSLEQFYDMDEVERGHLGKNGKDFFDKHFDMNLQAIELIKLLESRMG